jgi:hypothetical protein
MFALLLHPEVFAKAQEEIDQKTGKERLVDFDDRDSLPYFECVMKEVLRLVFKAYRSSRDPGAHAHDRRSHSLTLRIIDGDVPFRSVSFASFVSDVGLGI